MVLKLCVSDAARGLYNPDGQAGSSQFDSDLEQGLTSVVSSQVLLMLLGWTSHFANHRARPKGFEEF